jgi:protein MAK11
MAPHASSKAAGSSSFTGAKPKFAIKRKQPPSVLATPPKAKRARLSSDTVAPKSKASSLKSEILEAPSVRAKDKKSAVEPVTARKSTPKVDKKTKSEGAAEQPPPLPTAFKLIAGTYEKLLYGLQGNITTTAASLATDPEASSSGSNLQVDLKPVFIFPAHVSCVKAVSASPGGGKWLATGSADEIVKVWDLRRRKEVGGLMHHTGMSAYHSQIPLHP